MPSCGIRQFPTSANANTLQGSRHLPPSCSVRERQMSHGQCQTHQTKEVSSLLLHGHFIPCFQLVPSPHTQRGSYCRWKVKKKAGGGLVCNCRIIRQLKMRADRGPTTAESITYPFCSHPVSFCKFWTGLEKALFSPALSSSFHHKTKLVCSCGNYALPYKRFTYCACAI